jgi:hypothetical protein
MKLCCWTRENGAQSLVAWPRVCWTRENGGLGIKDLGLLNVCLLLKLLHRLHVAEDSAWAKWARQNISLATLNGDLFVSHWEALRSLLPLYQAVTTVSIGDGTRTSFWYDAWVDDEALADRFTATVRAKVSLSPSFSHAVLTTLNFGCLDCLNRQCLS